MTHYKSPKPEDLIPPSPGHHAGMDPRPARPARPPLCNFDYSGAMIEHNLLAPRRLPGRQETRMGRPEPQGHQLPRGRPVHPQASTDRAGS